MSEIRTLAKTPCGYVAQLESGSIVFGFLGQETHFPKTDSFIDFADALAAKILPNVPSIRVIALDLDLTLSAIDYQAFVHLVNNASIEARWWAGYTQINVRELGFSSICARPFRS